MSNRISLEVTFAEAALILTIRNLGNGYIESVNVRGGQPLELKGVVSRVAFADRGDLRNDLPNLVNALLIVNPEARAEFGDLVRRFCDGESHEFSAVDNTPSEEIATN